MGPSSRGFTIADDLFSKVLGGQAIDQAASLAQATRLAEFAAATEGEQVQALAKTLLATGVQRLILLSPLSACQQLGSTAAGINGEPETALLALNFESILILRPSAQETRVQNQGFLRSFTTGYLN